MFLDVIRMNLTITIYVRNHLLKTGGNQGFWVREISVTIGLPKTNFLGYFVKYLGGC